MVVHAVRSCRDSECGTSEVVEGQQQHSATVHGSLMVHSLRGYRLKAQPSYRMASYGSPITPVCRRLILPT